jgi:hypothetical protein
MEPGRCTCPDPVLYAVIDGEHVPARRTATAGPLAHLFNARCRRCHRRYTGAWRINASELG